MCLDLLREVYNCPVFCWQLTSIIILNMYEGGLKGSSEAIFAIDDFLINEIQTLHHRCFHRRFLPENAFPDFIR